MNYIKFIAFDADDTLWVNEPFFREAENEFCTLVADYIPKEAALDLLYEIEMRNLSLYGYGVKNLVFGMIEAITSLTKEIPDYLLINRAMDIGKEILNKPVELLGDVEEVLRSLSNIYPLVLATKGDLLDQQRKINRSGLKDYFQYIEIMSDKKPENYNELLHKINCKSENFMMIGNSKKSDILPVLDLGAMAIYIPFHTVWVHEQVEASIKNENYAELKSMKEVLSFIHRNCNPISA